MRGRVYITPTGSLWLCLREEPPGCCCVNLETGEVREMVRPIAQLVQFGWRQWDEGREGEEREQAERVKAALAEGGL